MARVDWVWYHKQDISAAGTVTYFDTDQATAGKTVTNIIFGAFVVYSVINYQIALNGNFSRIREDKKIKDLCLQQIKMF